MRFPKATPKKNAAGISRRALFYLLDHHLHAAAAWSRRL